MKLSMMSYMMARRPEHFSMEGMLNLTGELDFDGIDFVTLHSIQAREMRKMVDDRKFLTGRCLLDYSGSWHRKGGGRDEAVQDCRRETS